MATLDPVSNFAKGTLASGISNVATSLTLGSGQGALFPNPAGGHYNVVIYDSTDFNDPADDPAVEIVRVTAKASDVLTITRAQEGTSASNHNTGGKTYTCVLSLTKKMIDDILNALNAGASTTPTVAATITQVAHGLLVDNVIKSNGTDAEYDKSQADIEANAEVTGIVSDVIDADHFQIVTGGYTILGTPIGAAGDILFLDPTTAGGLTLTEPTTAGQVSKPIAEVIDGSSGLIFFKNYRGQVQQTVLGGGSTKLFLQTAPFTSSGTSRQTVASFTVPANSLGTNNCIRISMPDLLKGNSSGTTFTVDITFGGHTYTALTLTNVNGQLTLADIVAYLTANGATNAQNFSMRAIETVAGAGTTKLQPIVIVPDTSTIDTTVSQTLTISVTPSAGGNEIFTTILAELIR